MKQYFSRFLAFVLGLFGIKKNEEVKAVIAPDEKIGPDEKAIRLTVARAFVSGKELFIVPAGDYVVRIEVDPKTTTRHCTFVGIDNEGVAIGDTVKVWGELFQKGIVVEI